MTEDLFIPFKENEIYQEKYVQYLTIFEEVPRYRDILSLEARILYGFMKDRMLLFSKLEQSLHDEKGEVYIYISQEEMKFHCCKSSDASISKICKQLEKAKLIRQVKQGNKFLNGQVVKKLPNRIYLGQVGLLEGDVIEKSGWKKDGTLEIDPFFANGSVKETHIERFLSNDKQPVASKNEGTGKAECSAVTSKSEATENRTNSLIESLTSKNEVIGNGKNSAVTSENEVVLPSTNLNVTSIDTINDTSKESDLDLMNLFVENFNRRFLTKATIQKLCLFGDIYVVKSLVDVIFQTKVQVENFREKENLRMGLYERNTRIQRFQLDGEAFAQELEKKVSGFILQYKLKTAKEDKMRNISNYFRKVMRTFWENCMLNDDYYGVQIIYGNWAYRDFLYDCHFGSKE